MSGPPKNSTIAFVSTMGGVPWGGSEELWSQTALRLRAQGHAVSASVFDWPSRPSRIAELTAAGVTPQFRPRKAGFIEKLRQRRSPSPIDSHSMAWLKNERPALVVVSQGYAWDGVPWMEACRSLGIACCPIVQAHSEIWWPEDADLETNRRAFGGAKRVFFVSRANRNLMELQCGSRLEHAEVVNNPWKVDASSPVPWPEETGLLEIACVGRIDPRAKGQDLLLQMLALPKWRERPIRLNIYGDGPCEESLKSLAALLGVENVRFRGQASDVRAIWAANHALVLPSRYEGLPLVIVEAMFCGRMIVTTEVAGNTEYLRDGESGFFVRAPSVALLDEALERAWARKDDWQEMGATARRDIMAAIPADPIGVFAKQLIGLLDS